MNFATAALSLFKEKSVRANNHNERGGAGLYPLWEEGGAGKYAGEPFVLLGGSSGVGQLSECPSVSRASDGPMATTSSSAASGEAHGLRSHHLDMLATQHRVR